MTDDNLKINMDVSKGHLILVLIILFFIGGLVIGVCIGGAFIDNKWKEFFKQYEENINNNCECREQVYIPLDFPIK